MSGSDWVALITGLAWPLVAGTILIAYRRPISRFVQDLSEAVSRRGTKVSVWQLSVELAQVPAATGSHLPGLETIREPVGAPSLISGAPHF